jgi:hypothetical protein
MAKTLNQDDIRSYFPHWVAPFCYDVSYAMPTKDWLLTKFYPWFKAQRWGGNWSTWQRKNDCDNFARAFCVFAQDAHAASAGSDAEGLAVGEFCFHSTSGPHAIVCAIVETGIIYIEPQNGTELKLTKQEEQSCFRASF